MLWAPASLRASWASRTSMPTTCGTVRCTATPSVTPSVGSARVPSSGMQVRTVSMASSAGTGSMLTTKPSASSARTASPCVLPTTAGMVLPPQTSWS